MAGFGGLQCLIQVLVILIALSGLSSTQLDSTDCPEMCSCDVPTGVMDCSNRNISQVPSPIDSWVKALRLEGNPLVCGCSTVRLYEALPQDTLQGAVCTNLHNTTVSNLATDYPHLCPQEDIPDGPYYVIYLYLLLAWDSDYGNDTFEKYKELSTKVTGELDQVFTKGLLSNYSISINKFRDLSSLVWTDLRMSYTLPPQTSAPWYRDEIYLLIRRAASTGRFSFGMDSSRLMVEGYGVICNMYRIPYNTDKGMVWWYSQLQGDTATAPCPENPDQNATWECIVDYPPYWDHWNTSLCQTPSIRTKGLEDLSERPVTNESIVAIAEELANLTQDIANFTHREVSLVADVIQNCVIAPNVPVDEATGAELLISVSKMLNVDLNTLVEAERNSHASTRLIQCVERLGNKMEGTTDGIKIAEPQLAVLVAKPSIGKGLVFETTGDVEDDLQKGRIRVSTSGPNLTDLSENTVGVNLPLSVVHQGDNENIHFAVYNSPNFFMASEMAKSNLTSVGLPGETSAIIDSLVVSAQVGMLDLTGLNDSVTITLRHVTSSSTRHLCAYWKFSIAGWSTEGCNVTSSTSDTTTCECNHLTNFALLMDIYGTGDLLPDIHNQVLSILSIIGCAVSAAGLILTLLTYFSFRKLLKDNPSKILVNLCAALLGIIVAFAFTSQWFVRENVIACKFLAALTHYFLLAAMAWMLVEAFYMYMAFVRVLHTGFSKFLLKCCLIGWGIPLVVVGITLGISTDNYGVQGEICWLSRTPFMTAVMAPVALTLLLNVMTFGLVIHRLYKMNKLKMQKSKCSTTKSRLLGAAGIMVLLGLTWIFAFFAIGKAGVVFQYLFVVFNSLQGLFVFIFHCVRNADARQAWMGWLSGARSGSHALSSSRAYGSPRQPVSAHSATFSTEVSVSRSQR